MIKKYLKITQEYSDAARARGARQLLRLEVMIDVLFALMIYKLFTFMQNIGIQKRHYPRRKLPNFYLRMP